MMCKEFFFFCVTIEAALATGCVYSNQDFVIPVGAMLYKFLKIHLFGWLNFVMVAFIFYYFFKYLLLLYKV